MPEFIHTDIVDIYRLAQAYDFVYLTETLEELSSAIPTGSSVSTLSVPYHA